LRAACPCGFESAPLKVGGGSASYATLCAAPCLCDCPGVIGTLNYLEYVDRDPPRCTECGEHIRFFDDPALHGPVGDQPLDDMGSSPFVLSDIDYLCPSCRTLRMRFARLDVHWD
jgi:hypothetical protein